MPKTLALCFEGQFGPFLSPGIPYISGQLSKIPHVVAKTYHYTGTELAQKDIVQFRKGGYALALIGFSLGCSTITWLQQYYDVDLLCAIAESKLAMNYRINRERTKRSILFYGSDFLSSAGTDDPGFTEKIAVNNTLIPIVEHLSLDVTQSVISRILAECTHLAGA